MGSISYKIDLSKNIPALDKTKIAKKLFVDTARNLDPKILEPAGEFKYNKEIKSIVKPFWDSMSDDDREEINHEFQQRKINHELVGARLDSRDEKVLVAIACLGFVSKANKPEPWQTTNDYISLADSSTSHKLFKASIDFSNAVLNLLKFLRRNQQHFYREYLSLNIKSILHMSYDISINFKQIEDIEYIKNNIRNLDLIGKEVVCIMSLMSILDDKKEFVINPKTNKKCSTDKGQFETINELRICFVNLTKIISDYINKQRDILKKLGQKH